ncbi:MAG: type I-U CRISPR-associated protein Csx17 [Opitutaceae bacterium]|jgi:CRISPR-associated protein Csx17|nr:type I-U CRISPR-associated protein Csx17 [Opitutaceae bacterium]
MNILHYTHRLSGCTPTPLANYLKALGIFRILSEQRSSSPPPRACWQGNTFVLTPTGTTTSPTTADALVDFFLNHYRPTPVLAPWNGGSGFFPKDNNKALNAILASTTPRFAAYRDTIAAARSALASLNITEKPDSKEAKETLLLRCRNTFSETALEWLDAACVLTDEGAKYPPLLGTGGNDGRLEFTNNFMQRLGEVFELATPDATPSETSAAFLRNALFDTPVTGLADNPIGQFSPAASGGANASTGFDARSTVNPWDFILAIEGAMLFASAAVKRLESAAPGQLAYPFCVQSSGAGYGSAATADESDARCEIWMPLWPAPALLPEIKTLFSEGRAWVGRRLARNGLDFALAVASLGVDRGIAEFQRFAFYVRNGLAYFATPLQRLAVSRNPIVTDLIATCDPWLQRFFSQTKAKTDTAPGSIRRAARRLENAILAQTTTAQADNPDVTQELLIALGECERALATSEKWRTESYIPPIPPLPRAWVRAADTGAAEYRLAAALASLHLYVKNTFWPIRRHLEPVKLHHGENAWAAWDDSAVNDIVPSVNVPLTDTLCAIMRRRLLLAKTGGHDTWPEFSKLGAWPADIAAFIEGRTDDDRLAQLLWGLCLVDFSEDSNRANMPAQPDFATRDITPPAFYGQLKLCFAARLPDSRAVPVTPAIFNLAANGDGERASSQALRRLHASSVPVLHINIPLDGAASRRAAAALLFPLWDSQLKTTCAPVAPALFDQPDPLPPSPGPNLSNPPPSHSPATILP